MTGCSQPFSDPIALPERNELHRLRDAGAYIVRLPNSIYRTEPWRVAIHLLVQAAGYDVPIKSPGSAWWWRFRPLKIAAFCGCKRYDV